MPTEELHGDRPVTLTDTVTQTDPSSSRITVTERVEPVTVTIGVGERTTSSPRPFTDPGVTDTELTDTDLTDTG